MYTREDSGKVIASWTHKRLFCVVMVGPMGSLNGYVRVPRTHPWYRKGYSEALCNHLGCYEHTPEMKISVHGGLTFSGELPGLNGYWFGFDCSHYGDYVPSIAVHGITDGVYRDESYVRAECEALADQLYAIRRKDSK